MAAATGAREVARVVPDGGAGFVDAAVEWGIGESRLKIAGGRVEAGPGNGYQERV